MKPYLPRPLLLLLLLGACGPLVQIGGNTPAPASLLTLSATTPPAPYSGPVAASTTIGIETPVVPLVLQTLRLPVATSAGEVTYLAGAAWAEQPNRQFQRLLADTLAGKGIAVIEPRQARMPPARSLTGTLRDFGLDVSNPAAPVVRVRYDAQVSGSRAASTVLLRRFDVAEPVVDLTPVTVAAALNRAANTVAVQVADWVG